MGLYHRWAGYNRKHISPATLGGVGHRGRPPRLVKLYMQLVDAGRILSTVFPDLLEVDRVAVAIIGGAPWRPQQRLDIGLGRASGLDIGEGLIADDLFHVRKHPVLGKLQEICLVRRGLSRLFPDFFSSCRVPD